MREETVISRTPERQVVCRKGDRILIKEPATDIVYHSYEEVEEEGSG